MSDDLIERLRYASGWKSRDVPGITLSQLSLLYRDAIDEIERLRAEIAHLQAPPGASAMERAQTIVPHLSQHPDPYTLEEEQFWIQRAAGAIEQAEAEARAEAIKQTTTVVNAAHRLCSDVRGCFQSFEVGLREGIGNTNYAVISKFAEELNEAIQALTKPSGGECPGQSSNC